MLRDEAAQRGLCQTCALVSFLASDQAGYISGQVISISGGMAWSGGTSCLGGLGPLAGGMACAGKKYS